MANDLHLMANKIKQATQQLFSVDSNIIFRIFLQNLNRIYNEKLCYSIRYAVRYELYFTGHYLIQYST